MSPGTRQRIALAADAARALLAASPAAAAAFVADLKEAADAADRYAAAKRAEYDAGRFVVDLAAGRVEDHEVRVCFERDGRVYVLTAKELAWTG